MPRTNAPASRSFFTVNASRIGRDCASAREPAVVGKSAVSKLSLRITGTQCNGPTADRSWRYAVSIASAVASAWGFSVIRAFSAGPCLS